MSTVLSPCFIGGWGSTAELWHATLNELTNELTTIPAAGPHFLSWLDCVQDWPAALEAISSLPGRCLLVGWSLGTLFSLRAALEISQQMPEKIAATVLVSATPCMCAGKDSRGNDYCGIDPRILAAMRARVARNPAPVLEEFALQCTLPDGDTAARDAYLLQARQFSAPELAAGLDALASLDLRERLGEIRVPCRLLHGDCDRIVPLPSARFLAAQLPHAEFEVLEGYGHALPFTAPARIAQSIASVAA